MSSGEIPTLDRKGRTPLEEGLAEVWTEVDQAGHVAREIGIDAEGKVVHKMPSRWSKHGTYGLFDLAEIELAGTRDEITNLQFNELWSASDE